MGKHIRLRTLRSQWFLAFTEEYGKTQHELMTYAERESPRRVITMHNLLSVLTPAVTKRALLTDDATAGRVSYGPCIRSGTPCKIDCRSIENTSIP
jgi:hypothetical protein